MSQDQLEKSQSQVDFTLISSHIFTEKNGKYYIGKEEVNSQLLSVLKDEALYISKSRLWEILHATIINEAFDLAIIQSKTIEHVDFAKALYHWMHVFRNLINKLLN